MWQQEQVATGLVSTDKLHQFPDRLRLRFKSFQPCTQLRGHGVVQHSYLKWPVPPDLDKRLIYTHVGGNRTNARAGELFDQPEKILPLIFFNLQAQPFLILGVVPVPAFRLGEVFYKLRPSLRRPVRWHVSAKS